MGGERWFSKPATGFLMKMAEDIDLGSANESKPTIDGNAETVRKGPHFDPMRRKYQ